jgi:hypothetical protein
VSAEFDASADLRSGERLARPGDSQPGFIYAEMEPATDGHSLSSERRC